ncbi:nickel ABC transporter, nickel/metallophore periplasmic binding protein [Roseomonas terrae]|jgi:nickel transport system substrate-binding protein|uniref:Nickel ABC transporter, nickel/metallophore periplasmic binding protein n=1 Tax=Neoroseomonas terrae TaxID=424799 RepID=A0ABS5EAS5_9PROT|nr:nickel ABC transporter substrate-binding protein [Neoroseomonas terrae]MBR0648121.1 nickel ABC transporter, nickel/metallophore periplasmic binding protein [Neoroseomonas terrae]
MRRRPLLAALSGVPFLAPAAAKASQGGTLTFSWPVSAGPLNPHLYNPNQMYAQAMLYEPLVRYVEGGTLEPALATAWEAERGGRSFVFQLRQGVRFSDGTPFDAAAVVSNVEAVLRNRPRHAWLELIAQIDGAEALDGGTVRLRLKGPYYPALLELALIRPMRFASPAVLRPDGSLSAPVGTGPWRLAETVRGAHDLFVRNEDYWGDKPAANRLLVRVLADSNSRALALETGEIDLIYGTDQIDADTFRRFATDRRFTATLSPPLATRMLAVNSARFPTDDSAVRQAIAGGIDRAALVRHVLQGTEPAAETLFAENFPYCRLGLRAPAFDRAAAAARLDAAGWRLPAGGRVRARDGRPLSVDLCFVGADALQKALAEAVQGDLARIGIGARLIGEDAGTSDGRQRSGDFGLIFGNTWGAPYDPHAFMGSMRAPSHADFQAQRGLTEKAEIDRRIGAVLTTTDEAERVETYRWLLTTLHASGVYFPISYLTNKAVQRADLAPVPFGATRYEIPFDRMRRA